MERIGVYGGTFDPVHVGHVAVAVEARAILGLERLLMVVAGDPWQKRGRVVAGAADRLAMVEAVAADLEGIDACDIEIRRNGPAYTAETLEELAGVHRELFLVVGTDVVPLLHTWHRWEEVARLCTLGVVARAGTDAGASDVGAASEPPPPWRWTEVAVPRLDVSSRDIRARAAAGRPIEGLVPAAAVRVIAKRGLYTARQ